MFMCDEQETNANYENPDNSAFSFDDEDEYDDEHETVDDDEQYTFLFMLAEQIVNNDEIDLNSDTETNVDNSFSFEYENNEGENFADVVEEEVLITG